MAVPLTRHILAFPNDDNADVTLSGSEDPRTESRKMAPTSNVQRLNDPAVLAPVGPTLVN